MKKSMNKWKISTVVITIISILIIGSLSYELATLSKTEENSDHLEMPEDGQRPNRQNENSGKSPGNNTDENKTNGGTSESDSNSNTSNI